MGKVTYKKLLHRAQFELTDQIGELLAELGSINRTLEAQKGADIMDRTFDEDELFDLASGCYSEMTPGEVMAEAGHHRQLLRTADSLLGVETPDRLNSPGFEADGSFNSHREV